MVVFKRWGHIAQCQVAVTGMDNDRQQTSFLTEGLLTTANACYCVLFIIFYKSQTQYFEQYYALVLIQHYCQQL